VQHAVMALVEARTGSACSPHTRTAP
jgi:hypothetical protein